MRKQGTDISPGVIVRYVITKGKARIRDKAKLPNEVNQDDYDPDYYVNNQVIPAVEKIFEVIGYNKEELSQKEGQKKLAKFF